MKDFKKITDVRLPYDMRHDNPNKNYGIHGLDVWFVLIGKKGAVQFAVTFPVYLPHVAEEFSHKHSRTMESIMGVDVGYHAPEPQYEGQKPMEAECKYLDGRKCYYDGSSLRADDWAREIFSIRGTRPEDEIWKRLKEEYVDRFGK